MTDAMTARTGPDHRAAFRAATFADVLRSEWTKLRYAIDCARYGPCGTVGWRLRLAPSSAICRLRSCAEGRSVRPACHESPGGQGCNPAESGYDARALEEPCEAGEPGGLPEACASQAEVDHHRCRGGGGV
jgi:hypothetical protein